MELLQLKYFLSAAREENFSRTAAKYGVPPSDISQSIKRLERELGQELFDRKANRVRLSEAGKLFLPGVERALFELDGAVGALTDGQRHGQIRILAAAIRRLVMQTVERFKRAYPDVDIFVSYESGESLDSFDVVVADGDFSSFGEGEHLMSEGMVLAVNKSNLLSSKSAVSIEDLKEEPFVSMGKETSLSRMGEAVCESAGFTPNVTIRSDDPFYVRRCVELSLGVAIVPAVSWRGQFEGNVVLRRITDITRNTYVYVNNKKHPQSSVITFKKMLREECELETKEAEI